MHYFNWYFTKPDRFADLANGHPSHWLDVIKSPISTDREIRTAQFFVSVSDIVLRTKRCVQENPKMSHAELAERIPDYAEILGDLEYEQNALKRYADENDPNSIWYDEKAAAVARNRLVTTGGIFMALAVAGTAHIFPTPIMLTASAAILALGYCGVLVYRKKNHTAALNAEDEKHDHRQEWLEKYAHNKQKSNYLAEAINSALRPAGEAQWSRHETQHRI